MSTTLERNEVVFTGKNLRSDPKLHERETGCAVGSLVPTSDQAGEADRNCLNTLHEEDIGKERGPTVQSINPDSIRWTDQCLHKKRTKKKSSMDEIDANFDSFNEKRDSQLRDWADSLPPPNSLIESTESSTINMTTGSRTFSAASNSTSCTHSSTESSLSRASASIRSAGATLRSIKLHLKNLANESYERHFFHQSAVGMMGMHAVELHHFQQMEREARHQAEDKLRREVIAALAVNRKTLTEAQAMTEAEERRIREQIKQFNLSRDEKMREDRKRRTVGQQARISPSTLSVASLEPGGCEGFQNNEIVSGDISSIEENEDNGISQHRDPLQKLAVEAGSRRDRACNEKVSISTSAQAVSSFEEEHREGNKKVGNDEEQEKSMQNEAAQELRKIKWKLKDRKKENENRMNVDGFPSYSRQHRVTEHSEDESGPVGPTLQGGFRCCGAYNGSCCCCCCCCASASDMPCSIPVAVFYPPAPGCGSCWGSRGHTHMCRGSHLGHIHCVRNAKGSWMIPPPIADKEKNEDGHIVPSPAACVPSASLASDHILSTFATVPPCAHRHCHSYPSGCCSSCCCDCCRCRGSSSSPKAGWCTSPYQQCQDPEKMEKIGLRTSLSSQGYLEHTTDCPAASLTASNTVAGSGIGVATQTTAFPHSLPAYHSALEHSEVLHEGPEALGTPISAVPARRRANEKKVEDDTIFSLPSSISFSSSLAKRLGESGGRRVPRKKNDGGTRRRHRRTLSFSSCGHQPPFLPCGPLPRPAAGELSATDPLFSKSCPPPSERHSPTHTDGFHSHRVAPPPPPPPLSTTTGSTLSPLLPYSHHVDGILSTAQHMNQLCPREFHRRTDIRREPADITDTIYSHLREEDMKRRDAATRTVKARKEKEVKRHGEETKNQCHKEESLPRKNEFFVEEEKKVPSPKKWVERKRPTHRRCPTCTPQKYFYPSGHFSSPSCDTHRAFSPSSSSFGHRCSRVNSTHGQPKRTLAWSPAARKRTLSVQRVMKEVHRESKYCAALYSHLQLAIHRTALLASSCGKG